VTKKEVQDLLTRIDNLEKDMASMRKIFNRPTNGPMEAGGLVTSLPKQADNEKGKHE
jgi:hypothetical protein